MAAKRPGKGKPGTNARKGDSPKTQTTGAEAGAASGADAAEDGRRSQGVPVAGIGASAGGLDAFKKFFNAMPADSGIAFVLIPHLDPKHESLMVALLARHTTMKVVEAAEGMPVEANHVYIIPPNKYMTISNGVLRLTGPVERHGLQTSIDLFLRSLAEDQQEKAICIILSGTGSHGTLGLKAVKACGGMAMVQDPGTAEYDRMPQSAVNTALADYVLPAEDMPRELVRYAQHYFFNNSSPEQVVAEASEQLNKVLALLRSRSKFDFRSYRKKMLARRIERRMGLNHFSRMADYIEFLRDHPDELKHLAQDLLISVTTFFRDVEAFRTLETTTLTPLIAHKEAEASLRVWNPGCATGEESYSLAMLLFEQLTAAKKSCRIQLFATDVDEDALEIARQALYPDSITADVTPERLARFFTRLGESTYQVNKQLRETVVFARQNLLADAPFSKMDLISCRNLLIYLEPEVQQKVITLFHFALNEGGFLFLGPSETIGQQTDLFEPVSKKWRIYRRAGPARHERVEFPIVTRVEMVGRVRAPLESGTARPAGFAELTHRLLLDEFAPAAVLINRKYEVLYFFGSTRLYLEQPTGEPTQDLMLLAREGLRSKLRTACHKAVHEGAVVTITDAQVKRDANYRAVRVSVKPVQTARAAEGLLLVTFQELGNPPAQQEPSEVADDALVGQLEYELKVTREDLQSSIEELEGSNEELKASNEEVMSMNEELQSSNEELETSKEELQSLNEELNTVNSQLQDKLAELESAHDDIVNYLESSDIASVFLDTDFRIKRFTPASTQLFKLIPTDAGRPLGDIAQKFVDPELLPDAEQVLRDLTVRKNEVQTEDGRYCIRRILPYRTRDNLISGLIVTFVDVTELKRSEESLLQLNRSLEMRIQERTRALHDSEQRFHAILETAPDAIVTIDQHGVIASVNPAAEKMFGYTAAEMLGHNVTMLMGAPYRDEHDHYLLRYLETGVRKIIGIGREVTGRRRDGRLFPVELTVGEVEPGKLFTGILRDVSMRKALEKEVVEVAALEQQRIGQELHDNIGQLVTGLGMMAGALAGRLKGHSSAAEELAAKLTAGLEQLHNQVRTLSRGLVPVEVDPEGLRVALQELAVRTGESASVRCTLDCADAVVVENSTAATHLFRIAQEAVNNAIRHGKAGSINISLREDDGGLVLAVRDNGEGIQEPADELKGLGIRLMRNRAGAIGGALSIGPAEGGGTVVTCSLPRSKDNG